MSSGHSHVSVILKLEAFAANIFPFKVRSERLTPKRKILGIALLPFPTCADTREPLRPLYELGSVRFYIYKNLSLLLRPVKDLHTDRIPTPS